MPKPDPLRRGLEDALAADPDDLATHMAYADYLTERGDPRGEFIQVQLALEDPACQGEERGRLQYRQMMLLAHEREWLGELAGPFFEPRLHSPYGWVGASNQWHWSRGWLEDVSLLFLDADLARAVARTPLARFIRRLGILHLVNTDTTSTAPRYARPAGPPCLPFLSQAPFLEHLRYFRVGEELDPETGQYGVAARAEGLVDLVARMPGLEELHAVASVENQDELFLLPTLTHLRALTVFYEGVALDAPVANPALSRLETLRILPADTYDGVGLLPTEAVRHLFRASNLPSLKHLHLHRSSMGDRGVAELIGSGLLTRLETLDLRDGCVTHAGATMLARSADIRHLRYLSLVNNQISTRGLQALRALQSPTLTVRLDGQEECGSEAYLYTGDME